MNCYFNNSLRVTTHLLRTICNSLKLSYIVRWWWARRYKKYTVFGCSRSTVFQVLHAWNM